MKYILYNIVIFLIILKDINTITNEALKTLKGKIDENTIENEVNKIIQDYIEFNERYNEIIARQKKEIDNEDYDRLKYKEEFRQLFDEAGIFYEYFFKQRKRLSDFINKPTGKVPEQILNAHDSILEYVLESKNLVTELGEKTFMDNGDL